MVENNLQSLATYLGLEGKIVSPSREKINVGQALADYEAEEANNDASQSHQNERSVSVIYNILPAFSLTVLLCLVAIW